MSVEIRNLSKVFEGPEGDDIVAVNDFNLDIDHGEFIVLVGPSGCGKTTTLRCIAGLEIPTEGQILLDGEDITEEDPQDRDIAMVFQNYALYPHLSVRDNLGFGLKNRTSLSKREIDSRVEQVAELMDIDDLLEKNPSELSGGQQQRVATGRAIVRDPEVFLFDEPLSNLDAKLRKHMRTEIQRIQDQLGTTSIYVTHDQEEAMTMADRIAVLRDGELYQVGSPSEIYNNPVNTFVANFIGEPSMNMFKVEHTNGTISGEQFEFELSEELRELVGDTRNLILGIRPEDMNVVDEGIMTTELEVLEELGSSNLLNVTFGDDEIFIVKTESSINPETGTEIDLDFAEDDIYLFESNSTETIVARGGEVRPLKEGLIDQEQL